MPIPADLSEIRVGASPGGRLEAVAAGGERVVHAKDLGPDGDIDSDRLTRIMDRFGETAPRLRPGDVLLQSRGVSKTDDLPAPVRDNPVATAFFGVGLEVVRQVGGRIERQLSDIAAAFAANALTIIAQHRIVDWIGNLGVQKAIVNDPDDYLCDVVKGKHGVS
jgi:hypothetical protein